MDWFSWLSKTALEPSIVYNYSLTFNQNELDEDDIPYFNHEILQSMGISIAKHRLEILKLSRKKKKPHPMVRLVVAIKQTKKYVAKHVQTWVHRDDSKSALAVVSKRNHIHSSRWKVAMLKRNKIWMESRQERPVIAKRSPMVEPSTNLLMLTNGSPLIETVSWKNKSYSSPTVHNCSDNETDVAEGEYYSAHVVEDIRWDTMFQDLKPK